MSQFRIKNGLIIDNGGIAVTGSISSTAGITGSFSGSIAGFPTDVAAFSSSLSSRIASNEEKTGSYALTSSFNEYTASNDALNTTQNSRLTSNESKTGSFATTGSNYFIGTQVITGSVYIANDLIVQGSSSLQNITASAVSIGTNTVILNTDSPAVRFAGISVRDSGSNSSVTSSIWYDSLNNHWIYQNESGSSYSGGMFISGPRNTGSLGNEAGMDSGYIAKGLGGDHIGPSIIFESGSNIGMGTNVPDTLLTINGVSGTKSFALVNSTGGTRSDFTITENTGLIINSYEGASARSIDLKVGGASALTIASSQAATFASSITTATFLRASAGSQSNPIGGASVAIDYQTTSDIQGRIRSRDWDGAAWTNLTIEANNIILSPAGKVGIGLTNPQKPLDIFTTVTSATEYQLSLRNGAGANNVSTGVVFGFNTVSLDPDYLSAISSIITNRSTRAADLTFLTAATGTLVERMRITSGGNVGIGTNSADTLLHLSSTTDGSILRLERNSVSITSGQSYGQVQWEGQDASSGAAGVRASIDVLANGTLGETNMIFRTSGANFSANNDVMTLTSGGLLGIGVTPTAKLHTSTTTAGNSVGALFANPNQSGTADSVSINFGLGRTTDGFLFSMPAIKFGKEQQWTSTGSTVDGYLAFSTMLNETVGERMRITSGGNVGIGLTNPQTQFHINGVMTFSEAGFDTVRLHKIEHVHSDGNSANNNLRFLVSDGSGTTAERMRITGGGTLGIGGSQDVNNAGLDKLSIGHLSGSYGWIQTWNATSLYLNTSGNAVYAGTQRIDNNSDERIKENIELIPNALTTILSLQGRKFNMLDENGKLRYGFIAQEVQPHLSDFVTESERSFEKDGVKIENLLTLESSGAAWGALLVEAIKELKAENDTLKEILQRNNIQ
jgi:hypothetical protein